MRQVMILTKNVLFEENIQKKLQRLDFEVFCSSCNESWFMEVKQLTIFHYFQAVILSETFCNQEVKRLLERLANYPIRIFRIVEELPTEEQAEAWIEQGLDGWLEKADSLDVLREKLVNSPNNRRSEQLTEGEVDAAGLSESVRRWQLENARVTFSKTEEKVFALLLEAQREKSILSRGEICQRIWHSGETPSTTSQLSTIISKLRIKLSDQGIQGKTILTVWGKGYRFSTGFYEQWLKLAQPNYGVIIRKQSIAQSI